MIYISRGNDGSEVINLTKGDDAEITIPLEKDDGYEYTMHNGEYLIFSVREKASEDSPLLIEIESAEGSNDIFISHSDTAELTPGFYSAEAQLMLANGHRITVWPKLTGSSRISMVNRKNFCIMTEVVYR